MARILVALVLLAMVVVLPACGTNPLHGSDAEVETLVQEAFAARNSGGKLNGVKVSPLKTEGDIEKREFSGTSDTGVKVTGSFSYNKKENMSETTFKYEYPE